MTHDLLGSPVFTKLIKELMDDDLYRQIQKLLIEQPDAGHLSPPQNKQLRLIVESWS